MEQPPYHEVSIEERAHQILGHFGYNSFDQLKGLDVLDIGSGSAAFGQVGSRYGVKVVSQEHLPGLLPKPDKFHLPVQARPRELPFKDNSFDLAFSHAGPHVAVRFSRLEEEWETSGLTEIEKAHARWQYLKPVIDEGLRVLKPGGKMRLYPGYIDVLLQEHILENKLEGEFPLRGYSDEQLGELTLTKLQSYGYQNVQLIQGQERPILEFYKQ